MTRTVSRGCFMIPYPPHPQHNHSTSDSFFPTSSPSSPDERYKPRPANTPHTPVLLFPCSWGGGGVSPEDDLTVARRDSPPPSLGIDKRNICQPPPPVWVSVRKRRLCFPSTTSRIELCPRKQRLPSPSAKRTLSPPPVPSSTEKYSSAGPAAAKSTGLQETRRLARWGLGTRSKVQITLGLRLLVR